MSDEKRFSVDEILEAERRKNSASEAQDGGEKPFLHGTRSLNFAQGAGTPAEQPAQGEQSVQEEQPEQHMQPETKPESEAAPAAQPDPDAQPQPVEVREDSPWDTYEEEEEPAKKTKKNKKDKREKKEKKGFWARRREKKKQDDFNEAEDMYYGIQLKPIDEYTRGFDATGEISTQDEGYRKLFDENTAELDDEVAKNFDRLQKERRRRVA